MNEFWLSVTEIKKHLKLNLTSYFKKENFSFKTGINGGSIGYVERSSPDFFYFSLGVFSSGIVTVSPMYKYYNAVEEVLFKVRLPDMGERHYASELDILSTVTIISGDPYYDAIKSRTMYSEEDVHNFCEIIKKYYLNIGKPFMEANSDLNKTYLLLKNNIKSNSNFPVRSDTASVFRTSIILKLMRDSDYEEYRLFVEREVLVQYKCPDEWLIAYRKLCALLEDEEFMKDYLV